MRKHTCKKKNKENLREEKGKDKLPKLLFKIHYFNNILVIPLYN